MEERRRAALLDDDGLFGELGAAARGGAAAREAGADRGAGGLTRGGADEARLGEPACDGGR